MYHRYLLLLFCLASAFGSAAQTTQLAIKPLLTTVTAYLNGTGLEHRAQVSLAAGLNRIVVSNLSQSMDEKTLEVQLGDGAELLSVSDEEAATLVPLNPSAVDSLVRTKSKISATEAELQGLQQEKAFLLANQTLPTGTQANWSAEVQKGAALMRTRLPAIQLETDQLTKELQSLRGLAVELGFRADETGASGRCVLLVQAARSGLVPLTVHYYETSQLPWSPLLDIRASATGRELKFITHGRLINRTGLDWQQVHLVLMRNSLGGDVSRPKLSPWALSFDGDDNGGEGRVDQYVVKGTAKGKPAPIVQSTRYEVPGLVSLAMRGRTEIALPTVQLAGQPEYLAVPRLSESVFLQAKVAGWQGLQLPHKARVYRQGVYVGDTDLEERAYNDSLEVALGHDEQLLVGRAKLEDFSSRVGLSDKRRTRLLYELNVRNNHPEAVRIRILDQVPISEEKEITVKVLETSDAQLDERSGKLTWVLTLAPGASQRLRFGFQVDYPEDRTVEIINHRVKISNSKFR